MQQSTTNETLKDRPFNPFRIPKSQSAIALIETVIGQHLSYERHFRIRKRQRTEKAMLSFRSIVSAIVCDLVHNHLISPDRLVYIPLSKKVLGKTGRYISPILSEVIPDVLKVLTTPEMAFIVMEKGYQEFDERSSQRTTISCGKKLLTLIREYNISLHDLAQDLTQETIILKSTKEDFFDKSKWVAYKDNSTTIGYRTQLHAINTWLADSEIHCEEDVDISNRLLRRYFSNNSFESGGRLFGGFWQHMSKVQRSSSIYINEESVVTLDYSQAAPRIAYGLVNALPQSGDAYTLPSGKYNRKDVKKIFNAMIYADKPIEKFPKGTKEAFERSTRFIDVLNEILDYHKPISHLFGKGLGLKLMHIESEILITALLECQSRDIVALPVHDALIVSKSNKAQVTRIMLESFHKVTNVQGIVEED